MSATKETTNYKLPIFEAADQPTWLGDFNGAMEKIDSAVTSVGANASTALSAANNAVNRVGQVETTINGVQTTANNALALASTNQTTANNALALASTNETDIGALDGKVAQLNNKFPVKTADIATASVTAEKLDSTAVAAMWKSLKVRRFDNQDPTADNTGLVVPTDCALRGFYLEDLGVLVVHDVYIHVGIPTTANITLPSYVPLAPTRLYVSVAGILWKNGDNFASWTELYIDAGSRNLTFKSRNDASQAMNGMCFVLYVGPGTTAATNAKSHTASNGTM